MKGIGAQDCIILPGLPSLLGHSRYKLGKWQIRDGTLVGRVSVVLSVSLVWARGYRSI